MTGTVVIIIKNNNQIIHATSGFVFCFWWYRKSTSHRHDIGRDAGDIGAAGPWGAVIGGAVGAASGFYGGWAGQVGGKVGTAIFGSTSVGLGVISGKF